MDLMICYAVGIVVGFIVGIGVYRIFLNNYTAGTLYLFNSEEEPGMDIYAEFYDDPKKINGSYVTMKLSKKHPQE